MAAVRCCPMCHQPFNVERLGVRLPLLKASIVDKIKAAGDVGVTTAELVNQVRDSSRLRSSNSMRAHVSQLNELLASTVWQIKARGRGPYARWHLIRS